MRFRVTRVVAVVVMLVCLVIPAMVYGQESKLQFRVTARVANVRSGPSTTNTPIIQVKVGDVFEVVEVVNNWVMITLTSSVGYIRRDLGVLVIVPVAIPTLTKKPDVAVDITGTQPVPRSETKVSVPTLKPVSNLTSQDPVIQDKPKEVGQFGVGVSMGATSFGNFSPVLLWDPNQKSKFGAIAMFSVGGYFQGFEGVVIYRFTDVFKEMSKENVTIEPFAGGGVNFWWVECGALCLLSNRPVASRGVLTGGALLRLTKYPHLRVIAMFNFYPSFTEVQWTNSLRTGSHVGVVWVF